MLKVAYYDTVPNSYQINAEINVNNIPSGLHQIVRWTMLWNFLDEIWIS